MAEGTERNDWSDRIERALSGTTVEQVRELVDRLRSDLARVATHDDLAVLASREDLVRGLEAIAAAQQQSPAPAPEPDASQIEAAVTAQAERVLGGFAQRVGQLQTAISQSQEALLERIEGLEERLRAQPQPAPQPVDVEGLSQRIGSSIDDVGASTRATIAELSSTVEQLARRIDELASRPVADASSSLEQLSERVEALASRPVPDASAAVADLARRLDELAARPEADVSSAVERLTARVEDLASRPSPDPSSSLEQLGRRIDELTSRPQPTASKDDEQVLAQIRDELRSLEVSLRTEIDAGFRARDDGEEKQADALGLRVTNLSMSVTQALDAVRAQVAGMQDRAERLEAEQAAILEAIRAEVAGIGSSAAQASTGPNDELVAAVTDRVRALEGLDARVASAIDGIDEIVANGVSTAVEPLLSMRGEMREVADQAIQLGALPQMEAQLRRVEDALGALTGLPDRVDALGGIAGRLDALAPLTAAVERVQDDVAAIPTLREQVRALAERTGDDARFDQLAETLEPLAAVAGRIAEMERDIASLDARMGGVGDRLGAVAALSEQVEGVSDRLGAVGSLGERMDAMAGRLDGLSRLDDVAQMLATVGARLDELPEVAASTVASRVDAIAAELWTIVERLPASMDERMTALRDRVEQRLEGLHVDLGDVDRLRAVVDGMLTTARANEQRLIETAAQMDVVATETREEVGRALSRVAVRLDGIESAVARTILDVREALDDGAKNAAGAIEGVGGRLDALDERLDALDQMAGSVRSHLLSLPPATEIAQVVTNEVGQALSAFRSASEGRIANLERDLTGVTTNVNEIWMRARGIAQTIESLLETIEQRSDGLGQRIAMTDGRVEQVLAGEQRTAQRLTELEHRFVAAARSIESERDRVFVQAFEEIVERLAKDERRLSKRLRGLIGRRGRGASGGVGPPAGETVEPLDGTPAAALAGTPVPDLAPPATASEPATRRRTAAKKTAAKKSTKKAAAPKKAAKRPAKARSEKKVSTSDMASDRAAKPSADATRANATTSPATKKKPSSTLSSRGATKAKDVNRTKRTKRDATASEATAAEPATTEERSVVEAQE